MMTTKHTHKVSFLAALVLLSASPFGAEAVCSSETCSGSDGNFCGRDGQCYFYTCDNYYQHGNWTFSPRISPMACGAYEEGAEDHYNAVVYGCSGYGPGTDPTKDQVPRQVFNQKCLALVDNLRFECYRVAAETDFTPFLNQVAASSPNSTCDNYDPERDLAMNAVERFIYGIYLVESTYTAAFGGINATTAFDEDSAYKTMFAKIEEVEVGFPSFVPTPQPTPSPTSGAAASSFTYCAGGVLTLLALHLVA